MLENWVMPLNPHNMEVAGVLAREISCCFRNVQLVRRALPVHELRARICRSSETNEVAIERPRTFRVARMKGTYLRAPLLATFWITMEASGRCRQTWLRGITKLLSVAAS